MTRDDIIRMAREAGGLDHVCAAYGFTDTLVYFAALVAAHEREECAKVCDAQARMWDYIDVTGRRNADMVDTANICAAAIRARGQA